MTPSTTSSTTSATPSTYRSAVTTGRDGFGQVLRAEWTKFRSVRSTAWCLIATIVLTVGLSAFGASARGTNYNEGAPAPEHFSFLHRPLTGDGSITARVRAQRDSSEWAKAGVIIRQGTRGGSPYAAMTVTPDNGVWMEANLRTVFEGGEDVAGRWLRLTRSGATVTGYESPDGRAWTRVGTIRLDALAAAEVGLVVASPPNERVRRFAGGQEVVGLIPTAGSATFDNVRVDPAGSGPAAPGPAGSWSHHNVDENAGTGNSAPAPGSRASGSFSVAGGTVTVRGSGAFGILGGEDDVVAATLIGIMIGLLAAVALGVLYATSEYKTGVIRTTFAASPRRGRVLAAKAIVLGGATFAAGLVATFAAFFVARPLQVGSGYGPPGYPIPELTDWPVFRAVVGAAGLLALLALFGLGVGMVVRRAAGAIALVVALVLVPIVLSGLVASLTVAQWISRLTPAAGMAMSQNGESAEAVLSPAAGFWVTCGFVAAALAVAGWRMRHRDA
jgi:hypothetical protein